MPTKAILIGAGRGRRLMPSTADAPKCFAEVNGKRILDWAVAAFAANGIERIAFVGGYRIEKVQAAYPKFAFHHNRDWEHNNILASLFCAEAEMHEPFVCCYSDILFTPEVIRKLRESPEQIALGVDTRWRERYAERSQHPDDDAEKVTVRNGSITRIHRDIPTAQAHGEFIGAAKFGAAGAAVLREHFARCRRQFEGRPFREAQEFKQAYLIHLLQEMVEAGVRLAHVDTAGGYLEIDTQEDFELARRMWR